MKSRRWSIPLGIFILVIAALTGSFFTRDPGTPVRSVGKHISDQPAPLVDETP
jgi:hypothetical protein